MLTVARPTHCMPYAHCYKALSVPNASLHVTRLTGTGHHQRPSYICLSVAMLTVTRHHQCPMPPCHCCKASSVPYASLSLLQGITSALCLPVQLSLLQGIISALSLLQGIISALSLLQGIISALSLLQGIISALSLLQGIISALSLLQGIISALSLLQGIISALCLPITRPTAARPHQCPMPPCCKTHCCKLPSQPILSLRALCYYSLYTALCWSVFYTRDGLVWSEFYTPTVWSGLVWSGLCFIPNREIDSTVDFSCVEKSVGSVWFVCAIRNSPSLWHAQTIRFRRISQRN